jgi:hypothetical protein
MIEHMLFATIGIAEKSSIIVLDDIYDWIERPIHKTKQ